MKMTQMSKRLLSLVAACVLIPSLAQAAVFNPTSITLGNGLQLIIVPNHLAPVVTQMVWYKVGSGDEALGKTGLAHYLEHLMFRGTINIPAGEFSHIIAAHGGTENAFTAYDYTAFHEMVSADNLPMIMQMEADRMQNLHITPETATPELSVVLNERHERTDNNPEGRFIEGYLHTLMPRHPYGTPVIGWRNEIEKFTPDDALRFYQAHYAPNNAIVIISGDVDVENVVRLATTLYGGIPKKDIAPRRALPTSGVPARKDFTLVDAGIEQAQYIWEAIAPSYNTAKDNQAYAFEVLDEVLGGGESSILYQQLVMDQGIASSLGVDYDPDARGESAFGVTIVPQAGKSAKGMDKVLRHELEAISQAGIAPERIIAAKKRLVRSAIFVRDNLMMPGYAFGMALTTGHTVADVESWPDRINAVTPEQVNTALRDLLNNKRALSGYLLPDPNASAAAREAARPISTGGAAIR